MKRSFVHSLVVLLFFVQFSTFSQEIKTVRDIGTWVGFSCQKKFNKKYILSLNQELRLNQNSKKLDNLFLETDLRYKANKSVYLSSELRQSYNISNIGRKEHNTRYSLDVTFVKKLSKRLEIDYRLRYQNQFINLIVNNYYRGNEISYRNKVAGAYKLTDIHKIEFSAELFRKVEQFREPYFNQIRLQLKDRIKFKSKELKLSFGYERELNSDYPLNFFFIQTIFGFHI